MDAGDLTLQAAQTIQRDSSSPLSTAAVKKRFLTKKKMTMTMAGGDVAQLATNKTGSKVKWKSSNKKVISVKATDKFCAKAIALKPGKAVITARKGTLKLVCKVTVTGMLSRQSVALTPFETTKIKLKGAKAKSWKSSNENIVRVANGAIYPQGNGMATVTCTDKKGYRYTCAVNVNCPAITCTMDAALNASPFGTTYYLKRFNLVNESGSTIVLGSEQINYYPRGIDDDEFYLTGFGLGNNSGYLNEKPITVENAQNASFMGIGKDNAPKTDDGLFGLLFSVGAVQYHAVFHNTGDMTACWRV